jgi:S1-C subfamily serine protease
MHYNSVVQFVVQQKTKPSVFHPWKNDTYEETMGTGFVIDGQRILTCAHVISDSTNIMARKSTSGEKFMAKALFFGHDSDLALVTVEDKTFFSDTLPLLLNGLPALPASVLVAGYPLGATNLTCTKAALTNIVMYRYAHSKKTLPVIGLDSKIEHGASGGPAFKDDYTVFGVAFQVPRDAKKTCHIIPCTVIEQFLNDIKDGRVDGVADSPFDVVAPMESPDMRKAYKMGDKRAGVLVCSLREAANTPAIFKKDDVLLSVDGMRIANDGQVLHLGRSIDFQAVMAEKQLNATVKFEVLRNGKPLKLEYALSKLTAEPGEPGYEAGFDCRPAYFITSGLLFTTLSKAYIAEAGMDSLTLDKRVAVNMDGDRRVMLVYVLQDDSTLGYQEIMHTQVTEINGKKVTTVREVMEAVDKQKDGFITFLLANSMPVILDVENMKAATPRILELYGIPAERSTNLK